MIKEDGDQATLWEYLDWMLSPSSNSAAGMLIRQYATDYPPSESEIARCFQETPKRELTTPRVRAGWFLAAMPGEKCGLPRHLTTPNSTLRLERSSRRRDRA
jgi:hypothetical protein